MQIILTTDVEHLGRAGDVVRVKPGFGRNYLIPRGLALIATRGNIAQLDHQRRIIERKQELIRVEQRKAADSIRTTSVAVARKVGQDGKLFGSVTSKDIAEALAAQNITIDRKLIHLPEPLRELGSHEVTIAFGADVSVGLRVNVIGIKA